MTKRYNCTFIVLALLASSNASGATIDLPGTYRGEATHGFHEHKRLPLAAIDFTLDYVAFDAATQSEMFIEVRHVASATVVRVGASKACATASAQCDAALDTFIDGQGRLSATFSVNVAIDDRSGPWEVKLIGFNGILLKGEIDLRGGDSDLDGVSDAADNCTDAANPGQQDTDEDGLGNACDADIATPNDCSVNLADLVAFKQAFSSNPGSANWNPDADFNSDDVVNLIDLVILKGAFAIAPGPSGIPNICEPGVYVSTTGNNADPGTRFAPLRTISAALALAQLDAVNIYAASGDYDENTINVAAGTSIIGGLDTDWVPSAVRSEIEVIEPIALRAENVTTPILLQGIRLIGASSNSAGETAYGVQITGSTGIVIRDSEIVAGDTVAAADGGDAPAATLIAGTNGNAGQRGCENGGFLCDECSRPFGGAGGDSGGGDGGRPGLETGSGSTGAPGVGAGPNAPGGSGGSGDSNGSTGASGSTGMTGLGGPGGTPVYLVSGYSPSAGASGPNGGFGVGGGGGGGGGGGNSFCNSYGGGGGGGGGGGEGGEPGLGGESAGGSLALYVWNSTVVVDSTHLVTGNAGNGGRGGNGGPGAAGGGGGSGGAGEDDSGRGGNGGSGGQGGIGGGGGGGAGGPSIGLVSNGTSQLTVIEPTFEIGAGGLGGLTPGGAPGPDGTSDDTLVVP